VWVDGSGNVYVDDYTNNRILESAAPVAPTTSVVLPSNGATVSGDIWLDSVASSKSGITGVFYEVSGGPNSVTDEWVSSSQAWIYGYLGAWDTTDVPNGTYSFQSVATSYGLSTTSAPVTVTVNNPPPATSVLIPSNGATVSGGSQVLDAIASPDVTSVSFQLNGETIATTTSSLWGWYAIWNSTSIPDGTYTLQSVASYAGGVTGTSAPVTITVGN
jgi:hypothetical protein